VSDPSEQADEPESTSAPHGPEEVRAALLDAATRLFAEEGPKAVSVRQIAAAAGVNHGLVHHYFGSKQELLRDVVRQRATRVMSEALAASTTVRLDQEGFWATRLWESVTNDDGWKVVVRALLDGYEDDLLLPGTPGLRMLVEAIRGRQERGDITDEVDPEVIASVGAAMLWGALVLQPVFQHGLTGHLPPEEVLRQVGLLWRSALHAAPG
jgi:AcrR family transcriptional regulator